jgi:hypothetical protein
LIENIYGHPIFTLCSPCTGVKLKAAESMGQNEAEFMGQNEAESMGQNEAEFMGQNSWDRTSLTFVLCDFGRTPADV